MARDFDADEIINGIRVECGLAFALDTVKKLRQKISDEKINIEVYARPFANGRENGLRLSVESYDGYEVPTMNPQSPIIWLFCDRHADYPVCLLSTYAHEDYGLYDVFALENHGASLDFARADTHAADEIIKYIQEAMKALLPSLYGEEGKAAIDLGYETWEDTRDGGSVKTSGKLRCVITPEAKGFRAVIKCPLWVPYLCIEHGTDLEELKRSIDTKLETIRYTKKIVLPSPNKER